MKRLLIVMLIALLFTGCRSRMKIEGTPEFKADIQQGLALIKEHSPEQYKMVLENITRVYLDDKGFNGIHTDRSYSMDKLAHSQYAVYDEYKPYQIAAVLIHEGTHAKRIKDGTARLKEPYEEELAYNAEREFLKQFNNYASLAALEYVELSYQAWKKQGK